MLPSSTFLLFIQAEANTERRKRTIAEKLKEEWNKTKATINFERKFVVNFPSQHTHVGHLTGEVSS